jgi:hypothetical protein
MNDPTDNFLFLKKALEALFGVLILDVAVGVTLEHKF